MDLLVLAPVVSCALVAVVAAAWRKAGFCAVAGVLSAAVVLACGLGLVAVVLDGVTPVAAGGLLRVDALSAFMLTVVGSVALTATWGGFSTGDASDPDWRYASLVSVFLAAMSLAVLADNVGVLWVAIEATTIATAFLVGHHSSRQSVEAAWKYVVLASVGVAIAFLGIVLLYAATIVTHTPTLSWWLLVHARPQLDPSLVRVAGALAVLGFATKAGLAPVHSWLPDAHSQAPAPVSGLMSGVLLSVSFYAILRVQAIVDPVIGPRFLRGMLLTLGLLSLTVAAALIVRQVDLKRMLAYSSIEHMGVLAVAAAIGSTLAFAAALLHLLGHGLAKSTTFVASGRILRVENTTKLADIEPMLSRRPGLALPFTFGMAALLGMPPFSLFFSEIAIVIAGFRAGLGWATGAAVALLVVLFAGLARHTTRLVFGPRRADQPGGPPDTSSYGPRLPLVLALGTCAVVGFASGPFGTVLSQAAHVLGSSP